MLVLGVFAGGNGPDPQLFGSPVVSVFELYGDVDSDFGFPAGLLRVDDVELVASSLNVSLHHRDNKTMDFLHKNHVIAMSGIVEEGEEMDVRVTHLGWVTGNCHLYGVRRN